MLCCAAFVLCVRSIDIPGMFESKGVKGAKERLQLLVGDVRQPFPQAAQEAQASQSPAATLTPATCDLLQLAPDSAQQH